MREIAPKKMGPSNGKKIHIEKFPIRTNVKGIKFKKEKVFVYSDDSDGIFKGPYFIYLKIYIWFFGRLFKIYWRIKEHSGRLG